MPVSSTDRQSSREPLPSSGSSLSPAREYRRPRNHLFPLDDYLAATAAGGDVWAYCGIREAVPSMEPSEVEEVSESRPGDCVTCVDVWRGRNWVRL